MEFKEIKVFVKNWIKTSPRGVTFDRSGVFITKPTTPNIKALLENIIDDFLTYQESDDATCKNCKHEFVADKCYPCHQCEHNFTSMFEPKK